MYNDMLDILQPEEIREVFHWVLRVDLFYRQGPGCPLRAITHEPNGQWKPAWKEFQELQHCAFTEWLIPCPLPPLLHYVPLESGIAVSIPTIAPVYSRRILSESDLEDCDAHLTHFFYALREALTLYSRDADGTLVRHRLQLHKKWSPYRTNGDTPTFPYSQGMEPWPLQKTELPRRTL